MPGLVTDAWFCECWAVRKILRSQTFGPSPSLSSSEPSFAKVCRVGQHSRARQWHSDGTWGVDAGGEASDTQCDTATGPGRPLLLSRIAAHTQVMSGV